MPELRRFAPDIPIVLVVVGTKLDLRDDKRYLAEHPGACAITTSQGEELRKQICAAAYIECSSKTQQEMVTMFTEYLRATNATLPSNIFGSNGAPEDATIDHLRSSAGNIDANEDNDGDEQNDEDGDEKEYEGPYDDEGEYEEDDYYEYY